MFMQRASELKAKKEYGPSYVTITDEEILELVNKFKGSGIVKYDKLGKWDKKETIVDNDKVIGIVINNLTGEEAETSVFRIHYSDGGIHIVPDYPSKRRGKGK